MIDPMVDIPNYLKARGMKAPEKEPKAVYVPDPGHVSYSRDDLDRMGISMMDLMRQLDAENVRKRTRDLSPLI